MSDSLEKLSKILGTSPEVLLNLDKEISALTGKQGVLEEINLAGPSFLPEELIDLDRKLMQDYGDTLDEAALKVFTPLKGFFIKKEKAAELLEKFKPENLPEGDLESRLCSLRFTQTVEWMHNFFEVAYSELKSEDFEERNVQLKILDTKWLAMTEKFLEKKFHNVSHLKEYGIIFVIPIPVDTDGETLRTFTLLLHYLHEVPFYSKLFRKYIGDPDFTIKLKSLLRGDVPEQKIEYNHFTTWRIVQRYLAKGDPNDFRLSEHHVNPEAEHWYLVGQDLPKVESELGLAGISKWAGTDWSNSNLVDLAMSLIKKGEVKYLYHQREALWNRIFAGYFGRDKMNDMIEENIIKGFIEL